ncbi:MULTISPECIES: hypothetical protein [Amniculibacterium]|jgi:hypothetical protein|uniref:hypothetical protein n=1 Tax=Amniculibacterium TaxID=2715289 RepID=UPI000F5AA366|nr:MULTISPECIES: hypothetical protein [Amniculibacterium]
MKKHLPLKSILFASLFVASSCATTKYSDDLSKNDYSQLQSGKSYSFSLRDSKLKQKMRFHKIKNDSIIGFTGKKDSIQISLAKGNVTGVRDNTKATVTTVGTVIGAAGAILIGISAAR